MAAQGVHRAKHRVFTEGVPCELTKHDLPDVFPETCPVTGEKLSYASGNTSGRSATIDRLIPILGYTPENIEIVSLSANASKQDHWPKRIEARANMYPNDMLLQRVDAWVDQRLQEHAADLIDHVKRMIAAVDQKKEYAEMRTS